MNEHEAPIPKDAARLFVLIASESPHAVIFRRGPSKQVCTISWDLDHDSFKLGQWLKGRIYEEWADISPDGKYLLYHATKYGAAVDGWMQYNVLSYAPYLKAIKLWKSCLPVGAFISSSRFCLVCSKAQLYRTSPFGKVNGDSEANPIQHWQDVESWRLRRDGWSLKTDSDTPRPTWFKLLRSWQLNVAPNEEYHLKTNVYSFQSAELEEPFDCSQWDWADLQQERLLWARGGKIFAADLLGNKLGSVRKLADFNDWKFEPVVAPY